MQTISKFIYFQLMGWKLKGDFPKLKKYVVIVVPHTSWVDFIIGLLVRSISKEKINYIGKKSLFKPPFGWFFRWMGGAPIDRSKNHNKVEAIKAIFEEREEFRLALAPEGTRKKVSQWKTGFYYIAKTADVPIVLVAFDFGKKEVKISAPEYTSENMEADFAKYYAFYKGVKGKIPEYSF